MTNFGHVISSAMHGLSKDDFDGALPYLMLTSKFESVIRDRLAFCLHQSLQPTNHQTQGRYAVGREKTFGRKKRKKVDIVILERVDSGQQRVPDRPVAILEVKAVAVPRKAVAFLDKLKGDLDGARKSVSEFDVSTGYFGLLLAREACELDQISTERNKTIVKYELLDSPQKNELSDEYRKVIEKLGRLNLSLVSSDKFHCGEDLGATVNLKWWLFALR